MKTSMSKFIVMALLSGVLAIPAWPKNEKNQQKERKTMITDKLENAAKYYHLHPAFEKAFAFLQQPNLAKLAAGKYIIDGEKLYASIGMNKGRKKSEARLEAHRKYIDIQYVIEGYDEMGWQLTKECKQIDAAYKADGDIEFFKDVPQVWKKVKAGHFAIFFPEDAHAPVVSDKDIYKVVVKVAVE